MSEFIEILSAESQKQLDDFLAKINQGVQSVNQINSAFKQTKVPSEVNKEIRKTVVETEKLNELQKEAKRITTALERQKAKLAQAQSNEAIQLQKVRFETAEANKLAKQRAIISSNLATAYQKEQARISILSNRYKDLATRQEMGIRLSKQEEKELKDVTAQINRKQQALKRVDANMGVFNRNVGNYTSAWGGLKNIVMASVGAFGAFTAINIARDIFNTVKEIDSLNKALQKVTESQEGFNQAKSFLVVLAEKSGTEITKLTRAYTKFFASAKTTNLTLRQTQDIFDAVTTASATLGLSADDTEGSLRAIEQMLSKGNVQAEEIRGQLGERLPGAFQILAKSMGLTTKELNKQLELGNVLAEEVLPKFAEELRKAYDTDRVDTLVASQGRLTNAWIAFVESVEDGSGPISDTMKIIFDTITRVLDRITEFNKSGSDFFNEGQAKGLQRFQEEFKGIELGTERADKKIKELDNTLLSLRTRLGDLSKQQQERGFFNMFTPQKNAELDNFINETLGQIAELEKAIEIAKNGGKLSIVNEDDKKTIKEVTKITEKYFEDRIKELRELQRTTAETEKPWQDYQSQIENTEKAFLKFMRSVKGLEDVQSVNFLDPNELQIVQTNIETVGSLIEQNKDITAEVTEQMKGNFRDAFSEIARMYQLDASRWEALFDDKKNTIQDYAIAFADLMGAVMHQVTELQIASIDRQIEANTRYYEDLISRAEGNEQQQQILRQEQERRENELRRRRAQAEKRQAIFESIISTAVAVTKALITSRTLAIIVGALGAAKTALIASTPLPQYKKGRKDGKEEYAILGDGGKNEPILSKDGKLKAISPNKPTVMHLDKGDKVLPSMDLLTKDSLINASIMASLASNNQKADHEETAKIFEHILAKQQKETMKALRGAKFVNYNQNNIDLGRMLKKQKYR